MTFYLQLLTLPTIQNRFINKLFMSFFVEKQFSTVFIHIFTGQIKKNIIR
jgi:hypothetical protein